MVEVGPQPRPERASAVRCVILAVLLVAVGLGAMLYARGSDAAAQRSVGSPVLQDRFAGPDSRSNLGPRWQQIRGVWGVRNREAYLSQAEAPRSLAIVNTRRVGRSVSVSLPMLRNGMGVVFRYRDAENYWGIFASPRYGVWTVIKVLDGTEIRVGDTGNAPVVDMTRVNVQTHGAEFYVWFEHRYSVTSPKRFTDADLRTAAGVGLLGPGESGNNGRFENFTVAK
jgi:hypothetical protein